MCGMKLHVSSSSVMSTLLDSWAMPGVCSSWSPSSPVATLRQDPLVHARSHQQYPWPRQAKGFRRHTFAGKILLPALTRICFQPSLSFQQRGYWKNLWINFREILKGVRTVVILTLLDLAAKKAGLQQTFKHTQDGLTDKEKMKLNNSTIKLCPHTNCH